MREEGGFRRGTWRAVWCVCSFLSKEDVVVKEEDRNLMCPTLQYCQTRVPTIPNPPLGQRYEASFLVGQTWKALRLCDKGPARFVAREGYVFHAGRCLWLLLPVLKTTFPCLPKDISWGKLWETYRQYPALVKWVADQNGLLGFKDITCLFLSSSAKKYVRPPTAPLVTHPPHDPMT